VLDIVALEDVTSRAWPARVRERLGGWRLNAAGGRTGRANTCWALEAPDRDPGEAIAAVEAWYERQGQASRFKTTDGAMEPAELPTLLTARGYRASTETLVMLGPVGGEGDAVITTDPDTPFQAVLFEALYKDPADAEERLETLRRIAEPVFFARLDFEGAPAAVGACAVEGEWGGLSVMRTLARVRRQGLARRIVGSLLEQARLAGATKSYLQVEADNDPAVALYRSCGFETAYRYRYWARAA
jgi:GNAT superfamily N-acetyltransferase